MSRFTYRARNKTGQIVAGELQANNKERARQLLQNNELTALQLDEVKQTSSVWTKNIGGNRVRMKDLIVFCRQFSAMISAGVPIIQALEALNVQIRHRFFQDVLKNMIRAIEGGDSFSLALSRYPTVFSAFFLGLVRTGESSGELAQALNSLADYLEQEYIFRRKIVAALTYPALVVATMIVVTILVFAFVLPQLVELFSDAQVVLPLPTRIVIGLVNFIMAYWYVVVVVGIAGGVLFRSWVKTPEGRFTVSSLVLRFPIIRVLFQKVYLARITSMLHILFNSDVPVLESLHLVERAMGNRVYQKILATTRQAVKDGTPISTVWQQEQFIPPLLTALVAVGEQNGKLDAAFDEANRFFRREVEEVLSTITVLIEPIIVILLGVGVAFLVAAVFLPIYNLVLTI